ncbi:metalloprotease TldD [Aliikangiella sp. IMCC44359]|uniref:metalloprotease TldD n=1 Tax=Aliikangiella sp. IMCC44359 TaxID=3459125 RepID=UPI00403B13AE
MSNSLSAIQQEFLQPAGLGSNDLTRILDSMLSHKVDFAELYFQSVHQEAWVLEAGIVKDASFSSDKGVGVRALSGEKTGFAYSEEIILPALEQAAAASRSIAAYGGTRQVKLSSHNISKSYYASTDPILSLTEAEKLEILQKLDQAARAQDPRVSEVIASISGVYEKILVCATDGTLASDIRPLVRANVTVIMQHNGKTERGSSGMGGRDDYLILTDEVLSQLAKDAVHQASINLEAIAAPAGIMPVVLGAGWPGVLLHEAVGHGLEGDFNRKGSSAFSNRVGQRVASPLCTIVDDGTIVGRRGSLTIDDEGTPCQSTTLIENGILCGYMQDKKNAGLMKTQSTGNGRRESYSCLTLPRMTNTYMLAGESEPEEIIRSVKKGIYAPNFGGGQVDITSGKFVFSTSEAYLIENGKITAPVKGATLIGNGPDVLTKVSMVGNDLKLDKGVGVCGKDGQSVPVGVGQPTLKVDELTVGGTN